MMFERHITDQLAAYLDGELGTAEARRAGHHLAGCGRCREDLHQVRFGIESLQYLPLMAAPPELWASIQAAADRAGRQQRPFAWTPAFAAVAALLVIAAGVYWQVASHRVYWQVTSLEGSPKAGVNAIPANGRVKTGEWIATDGRSRARLQIGTIGSVEVDTNTRVQLKTASGSEHRLSLDSGKIHARITSPPRLFFVDTTAGTAVDLGCEYTLECDREGSGILHVKAGWVSYEWNGRESLVPASASCRTRSGRGPGTPYFDDAPTALLAALDRFDSGGGTLPAVLPEARLRDTLTLWHLLSRTSGNAREMVFDRMVTLAPLPAGVSREFVLRLNPDTLQRWKAELAWTW